VNVCILRGQLLRPPEHRVVSGDRSVVTYEVRTTREGAAPEPVPVVWEAAPASALQLDADDEVVVVGRVRRRWFRAGGATQSRTEVVADAVLPARSAKRVARLLAEAVATVEGETPVRRA